MPIVLRIFNIKINIIGQEFRVRVYKNKFILYDTCIAKRIYGLKGARDLKIVGLFLYPHMQGLGGDSVYSIVFM